MTSPLPSARDTTRVSYLRGSGCTGKDTEAGPLKLYWMKSLEAWPGGKSLESDRSCFDEDKTGRRSDSLWEVLSTWRRRGKAAAGAAVT